MSVAKIMQKLRTTSRRRWAVYVFLYFTCGMLMNFIGQYLEIARFTYWWQVISCYIFYMVPISILLRNYTFFTQYAYGLVAMGILEFTGYTLGTSYIYPNNILDQWFGPHTFALSMALFFALYFPVGNFLVDRICLLIGVNK